MNVPDLTYVNNTAHSCLTHAGTGNNMTLKNWKSSGTATGKGVTIIESAMVQVYGSSGLAEMPGQSGQDSSNA